MKIKIVINKESYATNVDTNATSTLEQGTEIGFLFDCINSKQVDTIYVVKQYPSYRLIKAIKFGLFKGKSFILNKKSIETFEDLKSFETDIQTYFLDKESEEQANQCLKIIFKNKELVPYYRKGNNVLMEHLQQYIYNAGYDVSLSSETYAHKSQVTSFKEGSKTYTFAYDYIRTTTRSVVSLLDLLNQYINVKFYQEFNFEPEQVQTAGAPEVVPLSACEKSIVNRIY